MKICMKIFVVFVLSSHQICLVFAGCFYTDAASQKSSLETSFVKCEYRAFQTLSYCPFKTPLVSWVRVFHDKGDENTSNRNYRVDPLAAALACQQTSGSTYSSIKEGFDVGHLTPIDILDNDTLSAHETNFMTNLVPQNLSLNRYGAWRKSERLTECYREEYDSTEVFSGVLIGSDVTNDHFASSHGLIKTPDRLWKVIKFYDSNSNEFYTSWIFDNSSSGSKVGLEEISTPLPTLVSVMESEGKDIYQPVINLLEKKITPSSQFIRLSFHSACHARNG
ncbi:DNA/RNA non-specific endonuclease [Alteromonas abrolhosensis]|uniref:DNA/RNA non-specific endonuclease n=1 Tax=Alteromonas abrolhosensis TaxID=1892904 RepID=UPI003513CC70